VADLQSFKTKRIQPFSQHDSFVLSLSWQKSAVFEFQQKEPRKSNAFFCLRGSRACIMHKYRGVGELCPKTLVLSTFPMFVPSVSR
jgi:hypothetical protein